MAEEAEVNMEGIAPCFHDVVSKYGREVFLVCWHANLAGEAMVRLVAQAERRGSKDIAHAAAVLAEAFNFAVNLACVTRAWSPELLAQVNRDSQLAWRESVREAEAPKILLH